MVVEHPNPPCPACCQPWQPSSDLLFHSQCQHHGVALPERLATIDTRPPPMALPPAPRHVLPLCCHRVILANPAHPERDDAWTELPDRQMEWAPNQNQEHHSWEPEWVCLRCNSTMTYEHPLLQQVPNRPVCPQHGPRCLAIDLTRNERGWVCQNQSGDFFPCTPEQVPSPPSGLSRPNCAPTSAPTTTTRTTAAITAGQQQQQSNWHHRGPPNRAPGPTHSWLYVPLLLAGTGRLAADAAHQWASHPPAANTWEQLVTTLQAAHPIPWQQLLHILCRVQRCAANLTPAELALPRRLQAAGAQQPAGAQVHLPWALGQLISDDAQRPKRRCYKPTWANTLRPQQLHWHNAGATRSQHQTQLATPAAQHQPLPRSPHTHPGLPTTLPERNLQHRTQTRTAAATAAAPARAPHRPPAPATAATPQTQESPPPNHFHHSQATRAQPTSHFKDGASSKHLLVSTFTLQATSWSSPVQHSEHHPLSSVDP